MSYGLKAVATALALVPEGGLLLVGPGVPPAALPSGISRRRVPPGSLVSLAEGAAMAGKRGVVALGSDADVYGAMLGALVHAAARNLSFVCMVLRSGSSMPAGGGERSFEPLRLAREAGATFLAQVGAADADTLPRTLLEALDHRGFALLDVRMDDRETPPVRLAVPQRRAPGEALPVEALAASVPLADLLRVGRGH